MLNNKDKHIYVGEADEKTGIGLPRKMHPGLLHLPRQKIRSDNVQIIYEPVGCMREIQPAKKSSQKQESEAFPQYECTRKADYFYGVSRVFSTKNEEQYQTIGAFWDEMSAKYGLENLQGLGYMWTGDTMSYAIGLKDGMIEDYDVEIWLWKTGTLQAR